jgi:hypothetical protein
MSDAYATGEPALLSFVTGLRADQDAVTKGLSLRWSSGSVEGHVNRIKMPQKTDVRPRRTRPAPPPRPARRLTPPRTHHENRAKPEFWTVADSRRLRFG